MTTTSADLDGNDASARGTLGERIGADAVRFARHFRAPAERAWNAITTPQGLAVWLGRPVAIELVVGGAFEIAFSEEDRLAGRIVEIEPLRRLVIAWHETLGGASAPYGTRPGDESLVTFELSADENGGTALVVTHRYIRGGDTMASFAAGWHAHLEALDAHLSDAPLVDRDARYARLKPVYDARLAVA